MPNFTLEQYAEAFDNTSPKLKDVLFADYTSMAIKTILSRHNVENDSLNVSATIGYILVGLLPIKKMIEVLQKEAELDQETARNITYEIREQIFGPVAQDLANIQGAAQLTWQNMSLASRNLKPVDVDVADESVVGEKIVNPAKQRKQTSQSPTPPPSNLPVQEKEQPGNKVPSDNELDLRL